MLKRYRLAGGVAGLVGVLAALIFGAGYPLFHGHAAAQEKPAQKATPGTFRPTAEQWASLHVEAVTRTSLRSEAVTDGIVGIDEDASVNVFSPFSGRVTRVWARQGDVVKKGAPLMAVAASETVQGQSDLAAAVATLDTAKSQLALAENTEQRQHGLYLAKAGALKDWLQAQNDLTAARNAVHSAAMGLEAVRNRLRILGRSDDDIRRMERAPADPSRAQEDAIVRAPMSGTVMTRQVGEGQALQSVSAGATTPVFTIANLSTVWLVANVRESDIAAVKPGEAVEVRVPAYPDRVFRARVVRVSPSVDPATHRIPVRAEIDNRDGALKPQMLATFSIFTSAAESALVIPDSAVVYEGSYAHVFVATPDGAISSRAITVGRSENHRVEVRAGLQAGEKIISRGALFIDRALEGGQ